MNESDSTAGRVLKLPLFAPRAKVINLSWVKGPRFLEEIGARGILNVDDLRGLRAGTVRVAALLSDGKWHSADAIRLAAGKNGKPATEGLRRARDLRKVPGVKLERQRMGEAREWFYRLTRERR